MTPLTSSKGINLVALIQSARRQSLSPEDFWFVLRVLRIEKEFFDACYSAGIINEEQYKQAREKIDHVD